MWKQGTAGKVRNPKGWGAGVESRAEMGAEVEEVGVGVGFRASHMVRKQEEATHKDPRREKGEDVKISLHESGGILLRPATGPQRRSDLGHLSNLTSSLFVKVVRVSRFGNLLFFC